MKGSLFRMGSPLAPNWLDRLTIFPRLMIVVCLMIVSMLGIWVSGFYHLSASNKSMGGMYNGDLVPILELGKIRTNLRTMKTCFIKSHWSRTVPSTTA